MRRYAFPMLVLVATALPSAAHADFRLCNNTNARVSVSLAYTDGQRWVSEGWWNLKPSACETLLRGPLAAEYYYVYAMRNGRPIMPASITPAAARRFI